METMTVKSNQGSIEKAGDLSGEAAGSTACRYFSVSEVYGPFPCENKNCNNTIAWTIKLTAEENSSLPEQSGPEVVKYIFKNKLGTALCRKCLKKELR